MKSTSLSSGTAWTEQSAGIDLPVWTAGAAFMASGLGLAAMGVPFAATAGLALAASAGSVWLARLRGAADIATSVLVDRALQGLLAGTLLWLAQLLVAQTVFGAIGMTVVVCSVFVVFVGLLVAEMAAAGMACAFLGRRGPTAVSAAILIDNRGFGTLGTLKR